MAILKKGYLILGVAFYIIINVISYTNPSFSGDMTIKIMLSLISLALLILDYASILYTKKLFNRKFDDFETFMKITLYLGVLIIPLISLYIK